MDMLKTVTSFSVVMLHFLAGLLIRLYIQGENIPELMVQSFRRLFQLF